MNTKKLVKLVDKDTLRVDDRSIDQGIVTLEFKINGISLSAQFDDMNAGLYAIHLEDDEQAEKMFQILSDYREPEQPAEI